MRHELEQVRIWARNRLQSGAVPEWSWQQHVNLIEALDSILHDMATHGANPARLDRPRPDRLRLLRDAATQGLTELSLEITAPARYQRRRRNLN